MKPKSFVWGEVIQTFTYDFDGMRMEVTKYHPWKRRGTRIITGQSDPEKVEFHCEELAESWPCLLPLVVSWIARNHVGMNSHGLVEGLCRALKILPP